MLINILVSFLHSIIVLLFSSYYSYSFIMDQIVFTTDKQVLKETLREVIREENLRAGKEFPEKLTRKQACEFLGIAYITIYHWIKKGIVQEHGNLRKKYFLKDELIEVMKQRTEKPEPWKQQQ